MALLNIKSSQLGILPPGAELRIPIDPPLRDDQEPVVFCPGMSIMVRKLAADLVVLNNTTDRVTGFVLVFAPSSLVRAVRVPWVDMARQAGAMVQQIMRDVSGANPTADQTTRERTKPKSK